MNSTQIGKYAEQAVAEELSRQGYKVIELNWKTKAAEIDIIAQKKDALYFIEVKYRKTDTAGDGFDYITTTKLRHMERAANLYTESIGWSGPYDLYAAAVTGSVNAGFIIDIREIA